MSKKLGIIGGLGPMATVYFLQLLTLMTDAGKRLKRQGAEYIAIPCVTAHYFQEELSASIDLPAINEQLKNYSAANGNSHIWAYSKKPKTEQR